MTLKLLHHDTVNNACQELAALLTWHTEGKGNGAHPTALNHHPTALNQLDFTSSASVSTALHTVYKPTLCIVVQGKKEVLLGEEKYQYGVS